MTAPETGLVVKAVTNIMQTINTMVSTKNSVISSGEMQILQVQIAEAKSAVRQELRGRNLTRRAEIACNMSDKNLDGLVKLFNRLKTCNFDDDLEKMVRKDLHNLGNQLAKNVEDFASGKF
jgi:hypothetical protein